MTVDMPSYSRKILNDFAAREREKTIAFLQARYGLSEDDCEDIFQESFIILWQNNADGKLDNLKSSLSTYFLGICKNKAHEICRKNKKASLEIDDTPLSMKEFDEEKANDILLTFDDDMPLREKKERLVKQIVSDLPSPCDKLLWGFFRDNLAMKTLAEMYNYSLGSVKVTKHRCQEKFRKRYTDLVRYLF